MDSAAKARHDLGNLLGIVLANLEGMVDDVVPVTTERLRSLAESVSKARDLLAALEPPSKGSGEL